MNALATPVKWSNRRLRFDVEANPVKSELTLSDDAEVSFVPMDAVGELGGLRLDDIKPLADVYTGYTYFRDGDVCIAKITPCFENGKGALAEGLTNGVAFGTTELHIVRPRPTLDTKFLFYISIAHDFRKTGEAEMLGAGGQKRVPERFIKDWRAPLPPLDTQKRIAAFLDEKTAQIDGLIAKKQALLERLGEKRQAVITQAVTKGLNPNTPMKPSGIDWLGDIPAHWEVKRLKYVAGLRPGYAFSSDDFIDDGCPVIRIGDVLPTGVVDISHARHLPKDFVSGHQEYIVKHGDIAMAMTGATVGKAALYHGEEVALLNQRVCRMRAIKDVLNENYLWFLTQSIPYLEYITLYAYGGAQPNISDKLIGDVNFAYPPLSEQAPISHSVGQAVDHIAQQVDLVRTSAEKLQEYRSALITAAVTGQIEGLL